MTDLFTTYLHIQVMSTGYDIPPLPASHSQFESRKTSGSMTASYEVRPLPLEFSITNVVLNS